MGKILVTCTRCIGRGYIPEYRANRPGWYARTCPGCGGSGEREPTRANMKILSRLNSREV